MRLNSSMAVMLAYPNGSVPASPESNSHKTFESLQRRKIGSIRDNPKLFKIRQQFENSCVQSEVEKSPRESLKSSTFSSKENSPISDKSPIFIFENRSAKAFRSVGRDSSTDNENENKTGLILPHRERKLSLREGKSEQASAAAKTESQVTKCNLKNFHNVNQYTRDLINPSLSLHKDANRKSNVARIPPNNADSKTKPKTAPAENALLESSSCSSRPSSDGDSLSSLTEPLSTTSERNSLLLHDQNVQGSSDLESHSTHRSLPAQKTLPAPPTPTSSVQSVIKENSVKKAILIYEGLSKSDLLSNKSQQNVVKYPKTVCRRESMSSKRDGICRRSTRRNSIRRSVAPTTKEDSSKSVSSLGKKGNIDNGIVCKHAKSDSGVGLSESEESLTSKTVPQAVYQTLGINLPKHFDHYDRLQRIHDMVSRIHKGQSSTCAACKAIPSSNLQCSRVHGASLLQVKCNESSPHHHPPCVCFSCQHSIFSCSQSMTANASLSLDNLSSRSDEDSLYYNLCCLESPSCDSWRRSRRRPVCEQNGRLCVVNCDMERSSKREEFYERLSEWRSAPMVAKIPDTRKALNPSKHLPGDSYDSDEGWVDISDSDDEKLLLAENRSHEILKQDSDSSANKNQKQVSKKSLTVENASYDVTGQTDFYSKLGDSSVSRSPSSEHLYETIADIENANENVTSDVSSGTNECPPKDENAPENDLDSGEWSTESSSPVLGESSNVHKHYSLKDTSTPISYKSPVTRFTLSANLDYSETAGKKTFIKSVLGKKPLNSKKRRMSHFFVPWLVSNQEYGSSRSPKLTVRKQMTTLPRNVNSPPKSRRTFVKSKRSQSIPTCSSLSCASDNSLNFPSTEFISNANKTHIQGPSSLPDQRSDRSADISIHLSPETAHSISQRSSFASSTYVRADQVQCVPSAKSRTNVELDSAVDVAVQKIFRRSISGESEHSYILFQPIKEEEVPLYQFYERNIKERVSHCRSPDSLSPVLCPSVYENSTSHDCGHKFPVGRSQLSVIEQLSPDAKESKMLWCELPEVKDSGILERISAQELKLQEAAFDFIQSQASYIRSLKVLYEHFIQSTEFSDIQSSLCVLSKHEHDVLFSDIVRVKEVSERLMADLTARWSDGILIPDICDIIYQHATLPSFSVYVKYCSNRVYQERTLKELKETRLCFLEVLRKLESNPACQGLSLESFLFLPMQHIARLPLLLDNIFRWLSSDSPSYNICKMGLEAVHKVFMDCNESARKMERLEEMFVLNKQLEFKECKVIPLISASRWLLKRGEVMKLEFDKKTFGRSNRCVRVPLCIFLFNDLLVVTKRKSEDSYTVVDYCPQEKVQAMAVDAKDLQLPVIVPSSCRYLIYLTLFNNHQGSAVDMILSCTLLSERTRWIEAIHPVTRTASSEVWDYDCPQVQCVRSYIAQQPDELSLQESDVVTIQRKMNDGWYEGRRLRDGLQGWFPASYTMDIPCSRARASNLRQCYRLLMLSQKNQTKPQGS